MKNKYLTFLLLSGLLASCGGGEESSESEDLSYEDSAPSLSVPYSGKCENKPVYEILVYSFADSNGDGIGDFQGIIDHLDYLASLNVGYLWLSPLHPSGTYHHYDVEDYYDIETTYGGMAGFESLIEAAKNKGIGIVMDMVFNHASIESNWFKESYESYFSHKRSGTLDEMRADPSDIGNDFRFIEDPASSGTKCENIQKDGITVFYEANFDRRMPEFDLSSAVVIKKQQEILKFYLDKGVAGFRFDGCRYFFQESLQKSVGYMDEMANYCRSIKEDVFLVGEYWDGVGQSIYSQATSKMPIFNFPVSAAANTIGSPMYSIRSGLGYPFAQTAYKAQKDALTKSDGLVYPVYFLNNHDVDRYSATKLDEAKAVAAGYLLTPGTPTMYYGEEIMLKGKRLSSDGTDARRRLPMRWTSTGDTYRCQTFDGVSEPENQVTTGALEEIDKEGSLAHYYKKVLAFRAEHAEIRNGQFATFGDDRDDLAINRVVYQGKTAGFLIHNFDYDEHSSLVRLPEGLIPDTTLSLGTDTYENGVATVSPFSTLYLKAA